MTISKKQMDELVNAVVTATTVAVTKSLEQVLSSAFAEGRKSPNEGVSIQTAQNEKNPENTEKSKKLNISDFEPKGSKSAKGYENWRSYDAQRTRYCYYVATNGKHFGCYENGKKVVEFSDIEKKYKEAKKKYEAKYHYVKKDDRA